MTQLRIRRAGALSTVQDAGRFLMGRFGIVRSGCMDSISAQLANVLVGNSADQALLEMTAVGDTIELPPESVFAIVGGNTSVRVSTSSDEELPIPTERPMLLMKGGIIRVGTIQDGWRTYLAVAGGLDVPVVLGSRSTYVRAAIGGLAGRPLMNGDAIPIGAPSDRNRWVRDRLLQTPSSANVWHAPRWKICLDHLPYHTPIDIRLIPGPHFPNLAEPAILTSHAFEIRSDSDRMGYRLSGPILRSTQEVPSTSEGVIPGTVQLPPDGQAIILLNDAAPTGGYPILGYVPKCDLPILAQLRPGQSIRWHLTDVEPAIQRWKAIEINLIRARTYFEMWLSNAALQ